MKPFISFSGGAPQGPHPPGAATAPATPGGFSFPGAGGATPGASGASPGAGG